MKRLILLFSLFSIFAFAAFGQISRPSVPFANYKTAAQITSLPCARLGTFVFDTTNGVWKWCSATGNPGTWSSFGGGGGTGLLELNGLTNDPQTFATGTSGTNFNISSSGSTHTFNFPNASGTNRGLLTSTDWTTFNNKGSVSSVALSLPSIFSVSGSPVTTTGTLTATLASQVQNRVFIAPNGSDGTPTFRALVEADIPDLDASKVNSGTFGDSQIPDLAASKITSGFIDPARLGSGTADNSVYLRGDGTWAAVSGGGASSPLTLTASTSSEIPLTITGAASQSANLLELKNSSNTNLAYFTAIGRLFASGSDFTSGAFMIMPTGETQSGIDYHASGLWGFFINNTRRFVISSDSVGIGSGSQYTFNSQTTNNGAADLGLARQSAGVLKVTDSSTGNGAIVASNIFNTVFKTADEARTSNNTLTADSTLSFAVTANKKYSVEIAVFFDTAATPDFKYSLGCPASPTLVRVRRYHVVPGTTADVAGVDTACTASTSVTGTGTTGGYVYMSVVFQNGANAGTFSFNWAQDTSNGSATTVLAGSYLKYKQLD